MNPNEREQVTRFLGQLRDARVSERDTEADQLIRQTVADNPDAGYLLVQRAMLLEQALEAAKTKLAQMQQQAAATPANGAGGFLGRSNPWAPAAPPSSRAARVPGSDQYQVPQQPAGPAASAGGSSFLGNIASTAAGVVAGSFLFRGIEGLIGSHGGPAGLAPTAEETTINNYYGSNAEDVVGESPSPDDFLADDADNFGDDTFLDGPDDSDWV